MFINHKQDVVISETDIEQALIHLRTLSHRASLPECWDRQLLLNQLRNAIGNFTNEDICHAIAPGLFAIIKPYGTDFVLNDEPEERVQIWFDPTPKSCSIQKHNSGMINTPLNGGGADEKVTIHRRADCLCPEAG